MKHLILLIAFLLVCSTAAVGQSGHTGQENNLRGLKGLRLVVMFPRASRMPNPGQKPKLTMTGRTDHASNRRRQLTAHSVFFK